MDLEQAKATIRTIPNWPKEGIMFRDITTLLKDPEAFDFVLDRFEEYYKDFIIDAVVGIESRGFIFGAALADRLDVSFIPIRKPGKLPGETLGVDYELEYGNDRVEMHKDAIGESDKVIIIDDLIATGGTAAASCKLVEEAGGTVAGLGFVIDLPDLKGVKKLLNYKIFCLFEFHGE